MDLTKQIIDQRINKILEENTAFFSDKDIEKNRSRVFLLLGVSAYLDIDIAEAMQYLTDGGYDGGFDAAYIVEAQDSQLNVVLFQSKYSRKLEVDSHFPANAVEKAVNTIKCVFDPSARIALNAQSREKVEEIRSFILDGAIPYVTFVMLNNGLPWNQEGQNHIDNAFAGQEQVCFEHFSHKDMIRYINRERSIDTQIVAVIFRYPKDMETGSSGKGFPGRYFPGLPVILLLSCGLVHSCQSNHPDFSGLSP